MLTFWSRAQSLLLLILPASGSWWNSFTAYSNLRLWLHRLPVAFRVQYKRGLRVAYGPGDGEQHLAVSGLTPMLQRRSQLCRKVYMDMKDPNRRLHHLIPENRSLHYDLQNPRLLPMPKLRTGRFGKGFLGWCIGDFDWYFQHIITC